jgi:hypothetical protein
MPEVVPLTYALRGTNVALTSTWLTDMKPTGVSLPIDGAPCKEYAITSQTTVQSFWFDTSKDWVIRRITWQRKSKVQEQTDISYERDERVGWVPTKWIRNQYSASGEVLVSTTVRAIKMEFNALCAPEEFEITFPPGCTVHDNEHNKEFRVLADGSLKEVAPGGGELALEQHSLVSRYKWSLISISVVLVAGIAFTVLRRMRRHVVNG